MIRMPQGQESSQPKPNHEISSVSKGHPGLKIARKDINSRDQRWVDIGSGIMSKTFVGADKFITTSEGCPSIVDIQHRKVGSLNTGKLLHECDIDDVPDDELNRTFPEKYDIRVEVTLRNALVFFERKGLDVAEIFSQLRACQEIGSQKIDGKVLKPRPH